MSAWVEGRYDGSCGFIYTPNGRCFFKIEIQGTQAVMTFRNNGRGAIPKFEGGLVPPVARDYLARWIEARRKETAQ